MNDSFSLVPLERFGPTRPRPPAKPSGYSVAVCDSYIMSADVVALICCDMFFFKMFARTFLCYHSIYMLFYKTLVCEFCAWCTIGTRELFVILKSFKLPAWFPWSF